jgi:hypothetical protein
MKTFEPIKIDLDVLARELDDLDIYLQVKQTLKERQDVAPFFKTSKHLCAALALTNSSVEVSDRVASELELFGDFACDAAGGDSHTNSYTLVEFEDAKQYSILTRLETGKTIKRWSSRFEHGFSQLVDWAWRLSKEGSSTEAYRRIFGANNANIHLLLIAGRDVDLNPDDQDRVRWRANNISLGSFRMSCLTFDGVLNTLRRRLILVKQPAQKLTTGEMVQRHASYSGHRRRTDRGRAPGPSDR